MENYLKTIQDLLAKPIKEMAGTGIEGDRKYGTKRAVLIKALEVLKTEHKIDLKGSAFISPFDNGGVKLKKVQTSTSTPEQYAVLKHCFLMALPKSEYAHSQADLIAFQKELGLTNKEKSDRQSAIANKKTKAHDQYDLARSRKNKALTKIGNEIGKFSKSLTLEEAKKANKGKPPKKTTQVQKLNKSFDNVLIQCDKMIEDNPLFWNNIMKVDDGGSYIRNELRDIFNKFGWIETK